MRLNRLFAVLLVAMLVVAGCKKEEPSTATPGAGGVAAPKKVVIGVVAKSSSNEVFQAAHAGALDAAKELGPKYGVEVSIDIRTPTDENVQKQAEAIESLSRAGVHGIAIACSEGKTVQQPIDQAVEAGVHVVCFDSDSPGSKRMCYYGTNDAEAGKLVMQHLAKAMGEKGVVAILAGNEAAPNLRARAEGVREEMKKYPNIKELASGSAYHVETPEAAAQKVQDVQRNNPEITGWALIGGWPLFTRNALNWEPGKVKVVSVDALPAMLPYLQDGYVEILLAQDCYGWGYKSVEILLDKIVKNQDPSSEKVIDPLTPVTKDNAAEFGKKWEKWLKK